MLILLIFSRDIMETSKVLSEVCSLQTIDDRCVLIILLRTLQVQWTAV
jgi:hypothetical protein